ncbi:MAG: hypothetical protein AAGF11_12470 [Myxococcota bacterium]
MFTHSPIPDDCPHCHARKAVVAPSGWWRAALVLGWVVMAAMVLGLGMTGVAGPFTVLPGVILYGVGGLPFLHARASEPATCSECGKIIEPLAEGPAPKAVTLSAAGTKTEPAAPLHHGI